jgi:hypothetical protein
VRSPAGPLSVLEHLLLCFLLLLLLLSVILLVLALHPQRHVWASSSAAAGWL